MLEEPAIVGFGRSLVKNYPKKEYKASLSRAFKDGGADCIILDSNRNGQRFRAACIAWAIDRKWLHNDNNQEGDQEDVSSFRLTDAGKQALRIKDDICKVCEKAKRAGKRPPCFIKKNTKCAECKKKVTRIVHQHGIQSWLHLCSLKCFDKYWLDLIY